MKNFIILFSLLLLSSLNLTAQDASIASNETITSEMTFVETTATESDSTTPTCTLTIEMNNIKSDEGQIMIAIYDTQNNWLGKTYKSEITSVENGKAVAVFTDIPYGTYAASAIHDKDMNGKLKTGIFGIPTEPYASSRGAKGRFGPPKWNDAQFDLNTATTTETIKF